MLFGQRALREVNVVVIDPFFVSGVVGRVDINALNFAGKMREQGFECFEVIAVDDEIIV